MCDAFRQFVDKEIRPHLDELETGALSPYPIARKFFSQFGLNTLDAESVKNAGPRTCQAALRCRG